MNGKIWSNLQQIRFYEVNISYKRHINNMLTNLQSNNIKTSKNLFKSRLILLVSQMYASSSFSSWLSQAYEALAEFQ